MNRRIKTYAINRLLLLLAMAVMVVPVVARQNLALRLDGKDNNVRTGIGFMDAPWTLEAWIKGDDTSWKETEVIFGGGEYSEFRNADNLPLVVRQGKLCSVKADLSVSHWLDDHWHHVALTCDGLTTRLYVDGTLEASKDTAVTVIPGAIGVCERADEVFGGLIDEVRVWDTALRVETLQRWMDCPLDATHEAFGHLVAYYDFDAGIDDTALNWVGSGYHSYHLRNGRVDYMGKEPLATVEPNDNERFHPYSGPQRLFNTVAIESEWDVDVGSTDCQIMKVRLTVQGTDRPLRLEELLLDLTDTERLADLTSIRVYYTGQTARSPQRTLLFSGVPKRNLCVRLSEEQRISLAEGANYVLVTADISSRAKAGNRIRVRIPSLKLNGDCYIPELSLPAVSQQVAVAPRADSAVFRVLQWNIWHGGRHVPLQGHDRIIELIRATKADLVTMQEGYGFQEEIAEALHYRLQTPSPTDNLCLFSRFPLEQQPSGDTFCSNPAIVRMGEGRSLLIDDCWLHYAYNPDYTGSFPDTGHNPSVWMAEDSIRPMANARRMLDDDLHPVLVREPMPVILGGDFNSCSHLDWTARTANLHGGYGPVSFPTSRFMLERGYKDSFRELHPDEAVHPEGTFAGIYGQLDFSRIDFIYYKGGIRAIQSKIVQTPPEIDDIWASDHSAVLTTFVWE